MEELVSIVMATYKTDKEYLSESINSILNQSYKNIELIIVCDGVEEEFNYIKDNFNDNRINLILNDKNSGLPYSLNRGIKKARGKYIARMDSDDVSLPDRIKLQKKYMDNNPNIEICGMYARTFGDASRKIEYKFIKPPEVEIQMLYIPVLIHPTVMFRKTFFEKNIFYNEAFKCSQDYELWSRAVNANNISVIPYIGLNYRFHNKQIGQSKHEEQLKNTELIYKYNLKKVSLTDDEAIYLFKFLYGFEPITKSNYIILSKIIDNWLENNTYFSKKELKKVIYNRYMIQMIKSKLYFSLLNPKVFRKIYNFENFKYLLWKIERRIR